VATGALDCGTRSPEVLEGGKQGGKEESRQEEDQEEGRQEKEDHQEEDREEEKEKEEVTRWLGGRRSRRPDQL